MVEIDATADPVRLSWVKAVLEEAQVAYVVFDAGATSLWPGAFKARVMVEPKDAWLARRALANAEPAD